MSTKDVTDLMVCRTVMAFHEDDMRGPWPYETLCTQTGEPKKVCYQAMKRAVKRGLLDYGMSVRAAWLTDAGFELVNAANLSDGDKEEGK
jgi:hypothetical protein